jgi:uncharacterized protein YrrD
MIKKYLLVSLLLLNNGLSCFAAGVIRIEGTVQSFTPKMVMIKHHSQVYYIKKSSLALSEQEIVKNLKYGQKLSLSVPFKGVTQVKPSKTKR